MNRARNGWTAFTRSLPMHRFHDWSMTEAALQRQRHCSVICQSIFRTKISLERSFPALNKNEHVLLWWIERETAEQRPLEVCRRIDFAIDWRPRPLWSSTFLQAIQSTRNMRCIRDIDLEKVWNEVQKLKTFFYFYFQRGKGKENFKLCMYCLQNHTQYFYTIVTYDTPNPR